MWLIKASLRNPYMVATIHELDIEAERADMPAPVPAVRTPAAEVVVADLAEEEPRRPVTIDRN